LPAPQLLVPPFPVLLLRLRTDRKQSQGNSGG